MDTLFTYNLTLPGTRPLTERYWVSKRWLKSAEYPLNRPRCRWVAAGKQGVARSAPRVTGCCGYKEARRSLTGGFDQVAGSCYGYVVASPGLIACAADCGAQSERRVQPVLICSRL